MDLYPLLPYQVDLIIGVVSGLRSQGGVSPHVGGANRTIIKLAQQLLVSPEAGIADQPVGALVTLDRDLRPRRRATSPSEVRGKIAEIPSRLPGAHPLAQPVAKAICMLQHAKSFKRTAENVAACLHPSVDADSQLASVREALAQLEAAHYVRERRGRLPHPEPAEDDLGANAQRRQPQAGRRPPDLPGGLSIRSGSRSPPTCSRASSRSRAASLSRASGRLRATSRSRSSSPRRRPRSTPSRPSCARGAGRSEATSSGRSPSMARSTTWSWSCSAPGR